MKIYTKTGDTGDTSLIGGKRVRKDDIRIEAYGTMDELSSWLGLIRDQLQDEVTEKMIVLIQHRLFVCGSIYAADCEGCSELIPDLKKASVTELENEIDRLNGELDPLKEFILPGGHPVVSQIHIARNICRRVERIAVKASEGIENHEIVIKYLNRLSDYLFVLSRKLSKDFNIKEIAWNQDL